MECVWHKVLVFLIAAGAVVPLTKRFRLRAVLGYLLAGLLIGAWGLRLIVDAEVIVHFAEFGVVLPLFLMGLELNPRRLWDMRRINLGAGIAGKSSRVCSMPKALAPRSSSALLISNGKPLPARSISQ